MNDLNAALGTVTEIMKKYRSLYEQNEENVRYHIVNPILRSLDWNPENPEEVQPNVSTEGGVPDYALIKNGKPVLFVEAKNLSVDIEQREIMSQLARYTFSEGTKYGVLTNGAVWMLIRSFEEGTTLTERIVWKADLENEELPSVSRKLITISRSNVEQIEVLVKKVQILDEIWQSFLDEPEEMIRALTPVIQSTILQGYPDYQFEDPEIQSFLRERIKEIAPQMPELEPGPSANRVAVAPVPSGEKRMSVEGEVFQFRNYFEVLVNTGNWLIKKGKLRTSDCPVGIGRKRNLVNTQPKHKYGDDFRAPKRLSNGLWIETHYNIAMIINYARRLLERFGYPPDTLVVER